MAAYSSKGLRVLSSIAVICCLIFIIRHASSFIELGGFFSSTLLPRQWEQRNCNAIGMRHGSNLKPGIAEECLECDLLLLNNLKDHHDVGQTPCDISFLQLSEFGRWLASKKARRQNVAVSLGDSVMRVQTQMAFKTVPSGRNTTEFGSKKFWADMLCCSVAKGGLADPEAHVTDKCALY